MSWLEEWHKGLLLADPDARKRDEIWRQERETYEAHGARVNRELDEKAAKAAHSSEWDQWRKKVDESKGNLTIIDLDWFRFDHVPGTYERLLAALQSHAGVVHISQGLTFVVVKRLRDNRPSLTTAGVRVMYMAIIDSLREERPKTFPTRVNLSPFKEDADDPLIREQRRMNASRRASEGYPVSQAELNGDY